MDLKLLFDEERLIMGEEQRRDATKADGAEDGGTGEITWCDTLFRRVRLFKAEALIDRNRVFPAEEELLPLYVLIEDRHDWVGEDPRLPVKRQKRRTYVTGPDSVRIRQAAAIAEAYGGEVN